MRVWVGETVRRGRAFDVCEIPGLREANLSLVAVAEVVRGESVECDHPLTVECPDPGPAHDYVGAIGAETTVSRRPALVASARSRGHVAPQADELAAVRERLDEIDPPTVDLRRARERVADASDAETEWRERVATLRGRVQALRDAEVDSGDAESDLDEATRRLSEVETERIAAEQALSRAREKARASRSVRRERLELEDRLGNLRRAARDHLADCVVGRVEDARDSLPDERLPEGVADALALARVADLDAPVALGRDADPFGTAEEAAQWLDVPVLRV